MRPDTTGGVAGYGVLTLDASPDGDFTNGIYIDVLSSGYWYAGLRIGGGGYQELARTAPVAYGVPQHLMAVYDPDASPNFKFYVDGILINSGNASGTLPTMTRVAIGTMAARGSDSSKIHIRDVRISNIARDASYALSSANALLSL